LKRNNLINWKIENESFYSIPAVSGVDGVQTATAQTKNLEDLKDSIKKGYTQRTDSFAKQFYLVDEALQFRENGYTSGKILDDKTDSLGRNRLQVISDFAQNSNYLWVNGVKTEAGNIYNVVFDSQDSNLIYYNRYQTSIINEFQTELEVLPEVMEYNIQTGELREFSYLELTKDETAKFLVSGGNILYTTSDFRIGLVDTKNAQRRSMSPVWRDKILQEFEDQATYSQIQLDILSYSANENLALIDANQQIDSNKYISILYELDLRNLSIKIID
jgi:hypothetical protein